MASQKNRGTFRAVNLNKNTTEEEFRDVLMNYLSSDEKKVMSISKLNLAPSPFNDSNHSTQTAVFRFQGGTPAFLNDALKGETQIRDKRGTYIEIDSNFWGLTQLYPTKGEVLIDVVALTGLNAHAYGSWSGTTKDGANPMWLQDFLATEPGLGPHCRSMIFGYNAKTAANASHDTNDYAKALLRELVKARSKSKQKKRPLVLLGHSYGGLIIAHAFTRASWDLRYKSIYHSTIRILCFGVPYRSISLEDVERQVNSDKKKFSQGIALLKSIFYEAERDGKIVEGEFSRCGEYTIVVSRDSAVLGLGEDLEEDYDTDGDHSTIVKFTNPTNRTYTTITACFRNLLGIGENEVNKRIGADEGDEKRQEETANSVLSVGRNPEEAKYIRSQMLRVAANARLHILVERLLKEGADPNMQAHNPQYDQWIDKRWIFDDVNSPPNTQEEASRIAKHQNSVATILRSDVTALALATKRGDARVVKLLLKAGANPNLPCSDYLEGRTPLHEACAQGYSDIVQCLLVNGADVNVKTELYATTPLHEVAFNGGFATQILVRFKADLNAKKLVTEETPLHIAARQGHKGVVYDLQSNGADVTARKNDGSTPLHEAAKEGHTLVAITLLAGNNKGDLLDIQNDEGRTALHEAVDYGNTEMVRILLEKGANRKIKSDDDMTALDLAIENGDDEIEALLDR
ncbi:hypothetical protein TWF281_010147 [Arthrobotrys megalospora]